jgi:putative membrane fusion protein
MVKIKAEGEKVSKDSSIFRYYTKGEEGLIKKIEELDVKIDEAMQKEKGIFSSDIKLLDSKIEKKIDEIYNENEIDKINEAKKEIEESVTKKAKIAGDLSPSGSYIKRLINERAEYEKQLNSGTEDIKAQSSGIVSYRVDGLENVLTPENFTSISSKLLNDLNLKTGQIIETSEESGKVINNFKFYIAIVMDSDRAREAKVGESVKLRVSMQEELSAKIAYIGEEPDGVRVIIFETTNYIQELISYRKISLDVIWWSYEGLKVPNEALIKEGELTYVIRNRAGYLDKILVKVLRQNQAYSLVGKYTNEDLKELGFTDKEIMNIKSIALYDEILVGQQ